MRKTYEQDFLDCSYGFRPGRSAHDAIRALDGVAMRGHANYIVEADIVSFFDSIDRKLLMEMLRDRIADETLMRHGMAIRAAGDTATRAWMAIAAAWDDKSCTCNDLDILAPSSCLFSIGVRVAPLADEPGPIKP